MIKNYKKKDSAEIHIIPFVFLVLCISVMLMCAIIMNNMIHYTRNQIEDAVAVSNMATLVIDKNIYYNSIAELSLNFTEDEVYEEAELHINPDIAFITIKECLKTNLDLSDDWKMIKSDMVDTISLDEMIVYNVKPYIDVNGDIKHRICINKYNQYGAVSVDTIDEADGGDILTPNGKYIMENGHVTAESCNYVRLKFEIKTLFNDYTEQTHDSVVELRRN